MNVQFSTQVSRIKPLFGYLNKQRENQKFVRTLEITATFILISFFLFFAVRPTFLTISALLGDIKSKQLMKQELRTKINNVIKAQDLFSQTQEKYAIINNSLPDRPEFFNASNQIQKIGQETGVNINSFSVGLPEDMQSKLDPNIDTYSISLAIDGDFGNAMKIIKGLLKNRRLINIDSFSVGKQTEASPSASAGGVSTSFSTNFYYWNESYGKK